MPEGATASVSRSNANRFIKGTSIEKPPNQDGTGLRTLFMHPIMFFLPCAVVGICSYYAGWSKLLTFWLNFTALFPLAYVFNEVVAELPGILKNDMMSAFLDVFLLNYVDLMIVWRALYRSRLNLVKAIILGSPIFNTLMVTGMSFFFGGIFTKKKAGSYADLAGARLNQPTDEISQFQVEEKVQFFNTQSVTLNVVSVLLVFLAMSLVNGLDSVTEIEHEPSLLPFSRGASTIIFSVYVGFIIFQTITHREMLYDDDEDGQDEDPAFSCRATCVLLVVSMSLIAVCSRLLMIAVGSVIDDAHIGEQFLGVILLPVLTNISSLLDGVKFAMQEKPSISLGLALGSTTNTFLFILPVTVLGGWILGQPMDLNFGQLHTTALNVIIDVVLLVILDGQSHWFSGYCLCAAYAITALLYWYVPNEAVMG